MDATPFTEPIVLESGAARVAVRSGPRGDIRLDVAVRGHGAGSAETGRLVCEAVHRARMLHATHIEGGLDASGPTCGAVLAALHRSIGEDLEAIAMRRAGSSVMVALDLRPLPPASAPPTARATHVPTQAGRRTAPAVPTPAG